MDTAQFYSRVEQLLKENNWTRNRLAKESGIVRLELTVECENDGAKTLYERMGFEIEGIRPKSMKVNGRFVDEYYMGKILK